MSKKKAQTSQTLLIPEDPDEPQGGARHRPGHSSPLGQATPATETSDISRDNAPDPIEEMVGALFDPLIVYPSGWEDTLPEELKKRLPVERLVHQMKCLHGEARWDESCDLEALLYLYPVTMAHPISEQWTRIYLYLGTKAMGEKIPSDIRQETLSDYDMGELRDLKRWIQKQKLKARKERRKGEKATEVVEAKVEHPKLF